MPISEIIEKEGFNKQPKQLSEFAIEVPARDYSTNPKTIDPIVRALQGNPKLSTLQKLVNSAGCKLVKPFGFILENSGKVITISQLIAFYGINTTNATRCPICSLPFTYDVILFHLEGTYESGHKLKPKEVTELFEQRFYNWEYRNGKFIK